MKKYIITAIAATVLSSTLGLTSHSQQSIAKENPIVHTSAAKNTVFFGLKAKDSQAKVKKIAKKKGWKLVADPYDEGDLTYKNVQFLGYKYSEMTFVFDHQNKLTMISGLISNQKKMKNIASKKLENEHTTIVKKIQADISKKGKMNKIVGEFSNTYSTAWKVNKIEVRLTSGYLHELYITF